MKMLLLFVLLPAACIAASNDADAVASREMLSQHETIAVFVGTNYHTCLGRTSRCPNDCGESGIMATFSICTYLSYKKPGEYGDPKQTTYQFLVEDNTQKAKVETETRTAINAMKPGDFLLLSWQHDYLTSNGGSKWPERTVTKVEKLSREDAAKKLGDLKKCDAATNPPPTPVRSRMMPMAR